MEARSSGKRTVVALVVGTSPEAIKMAPIHRALGQSRELEPVLISSGQHRELLGATLESLGLLPNHDLALMVPDQAPNDVARRIFDRMPDVLAALCPKAVVVPGDTTTALATALVAHHLQIPGAHVAAGIPSYDLFNPFPQGAQRQNIDPVSEWCLAPPPTPIGNLLAQ